MQPFEASLTTLDLNAQGITFLVGENGCGKSRNLVELAKQARARKQPVLPISNTVYDRFPRSRGTYSQLAGNFRHKLPRRSLQQALVSEPKTREQNLERICKVLTYLGFSSQIGVSIMPLSRTPGGFGRKTFERIGLLEYLNRELKRQPEGIIWLPGSEGFGMSSLNFLDALWQEVGRTNDMPVFLDFHLKKDGRVLPLDQASSGESTLLATYAFIASNIERHSLLLIDEPENSLHPRWQHEYCVRLFDMFYLYSPQIVIATHSPVIVSGAQSHELPVQILEVRGSQLFPMPATNSIEEMLFENFGTLSPSNHFLSEMVAKLLDGLNRRTLTENEFSRRIDEFESRSYDPTQREFLKNVRELGRSVLTSLNQVS